MTKTCPEDDDGADFEDEEDIISECEELGVPTAKRRKLANDEALELFLNSGLYPEYLV